MDLDKYNFKNVKDKLDKYWQKLQIYTWQENEPKEDTFIVDTPPPTVSGQLHLGHIFSYSQTDFIVRFQRMTGKNIYYPIGFDNNGLPTERLVQKKMGISPINISRDEFIKICYEVVKEEQEKFRNLIKNISLSIDWNLEYQTISPLVRKLSQMSFLDLAQKGQIYRSNQPVLWDTIDQTALANFEIEDKEKPSVMNYISFDLLDGLKIVVATTRPELIPACVAIFINPSDERYSNLIGKYAITPLFEEKVPILADESVILEKGTGIVMCCTFGDIIDVHWWRKYKLSNRIVINKKGEIVIPDAFCNYKNNKFFKALIGLKVSEARSRILEMLKQGGYLVEQINITHMVKCAERSGTELEILLTPQWFIKSVEHKKKLLELSNSINWFPTNMKHRLDVWIQNLSLDWCISRQRFFGVPIPVWYKNKEIIFANVEDLPVDPIKTLPKGYGVDDDIEPEFDVMDTWATSSVSPQINSGAINKEFFIDYKRHLKLFPADLRPQAHEIIRTWAFGTILKSYLHDNSIPWKNIMISGWCLDKNKEKMSKSKGNIINPEALLDQYGADVIRYWSGNAKLGVDTVFSDNIIYNGKRLINKLWNAAKFSSLHFKDLLGNLVSLQDLIINKTIIHTTDLWILTKLNLLIKNITNYFKEYNYSSALEVLESFFWVDFCDNYLEVIKARIYNKNIYGHISAVYALYNVLLNTIKLFAPFLPYITEEIFQILFAGSNQSIHERKMWPLNFTIDDSNKFYEQGEYMSDILSLVRRIKAQCKLSVKHSIKCLEVNCPCVLNEDIISDLQEVTISSCMKFTTRFDSEGIKLSNHKISINAII